MGLRDCEEASDGTLRLVMGVVAAEQGTGSGHRQTGVMARWRLPALASAKLNWTGAGKGAKRKEVLVPGADGPQEGQGPGPLG